MASEILEYNLKFWTDVEAEVGPDGKPTGEKIPVDWVSYGPAVIDGKPNTTYMVNEKVRRLHPDNFKIYPGQDGGEMFKVVNLRWASISAAYDAWKDGRQPVESGTPLSAWSTLRSDELDTLLIYKIKTVEAVASMSDTMCSKMPLPNSWGLRDLAKEFLENNKKASENDTIEDLKAEIERLKSALPGPEVHMVDPVDPEYSALVQELEARGIKYDKRVKDPDKLRAILNEGAKDAA